MQPWVKNYQPGVPAQIDLPHRIVVQDVWAVPSPRRAGAPPGGVSSTSYRELGEQVDEGLR